MYIKGKPAIGNAIFFRIKFFNIFGLKILKEIPITNLKAHA